MLPDAVVMVMLKRELLLTRAKLHALHYEHIMGERKMRTYKSQLKQARRPCAVRLQGCGVLVMAVHAVCFMFLRHAGGTA